MKKTESYLIKALLHGGVMALSLYEYELKEDVDEHRKSLIEDQDDFMFTITEHDGHVAMMLLDQSGEVYINEAARDWLIDRWGKAYKPNILKLMPYYLSELKQGRIPVQGIKMMK